MAERPVMMPTILVTGFLGAGNTTLLKRLINHYQNKRIVMLINEFGKIGIVPKCCLKVVMKRSN